MEGTTVRHNAVPSIIGDNQVWTVVPTGHNPATVRKTGMRVRGVINSVVDLYAFGTSRPVSDLYPYSVHQAKKYP